MTERETRQLPSFVWVALIASAALHAINAVVFTRGFDFGWLGMRSIVAANALSITAIVVTGVAIVQLRRRLVGVAAVGAQIAMWAVVATVCAFAAHEVWQAGDHFSRASEQTFWYVRWALELTVTIGLVIAAHRSRTLVIAGAALLLFRSLPPFAWEELGSVLGDHAWTRMISTLIHATGTTGVLLLLLGASRGTDPSVPSLAIRGFRLAARGVWLRVIAAIVGVCVTFMMFAASRGSGKGVEMALVAALLVNMVSFGMFGIGALQVACSKVDGMSRFAFGMAGVLGLWCGSVMFIQAPSFYSMMAGGGDSHYQEDFLDALSIAQLLVATLSAALLAGGIATFANARGDSGGLGRQARSAGVTFVGLTLFSMIAQQVLIREVTTAAGGAMVLLLATVCALIAQVALAQLCTAASTSIDSEPTIPTAIVLP
jgi:hypothetical protein